MKITLAELTFLPLSLLVATLAVSLVDKYVDAHSRITYRWQVALRDVWSLRIGLRAHPLLGETPADVDTVNQYLSQSPINLPQFSELRGLDNRLDPWGNPYVCVELPGDTDERYRPWHFYSTGRDGKSATNGNDPDDISSWKQQDVATHYSREVRESKRITTVLLGLAFSPAILVALVFLKRRYLGNPFRADNTT